ncbi:acyltransferase family protein [Cellulophaga lytica]|uniref:Heparan-alpha-glucosaminide N-acetyltransferase n=1 Tax=Cellulophaga lytica (strain ATCC 23178 / DSM 7489 / JCM 8516 / NBRC 14961 / NCIMB 1423 / VKM B-1433 / Cy l20) TaxID=867900 RepID=F0RGS2_CELLC|nr:heparan-alpha-glucosaminide N-acetyltransferase [Cellulophaga lytica]ADY29101.1 Heparan-alpha-glucosaminide N-acetyltransferase [Cellulophaga lytica DSM 7489]AIM60143.1 heparan-alpha-glucosaminide N-acetyltransferase [Cellulophaga lytica]WQG76727.1 heparan-alpha-glucosaminide N-acetyltransferase [Cellulophaga lytica]
MKNRVVSVDIFRGITIVLMILVNNPGTWSSVYAPFLHADWHGYTPTDLVFPFFLFIVGISIVYAYHTKEVTGKTYRKIVIRSLKLIGLGLFLGAFTLSFPFFKDFNDIRFPGVLQRIGLVFFFTAILFIKLNWKALVAVCAAILIMYWLWMGFVPINGTAPTFDRAPNNWANFIDLKVLGSHMWKTDYDPEGVLSTLPAIATSLLGVFVGLLLKSAYKKKTQILLLLGVSLLTAGHIWDLFFPINKALWSSSFVLVTAGWATIILAVIYYFSDVKNKKFGGVFKYAGANAITVFFLSSFIAKLFALIKVGNTSVHGWLFKNLYVHQFISLKISSIVYALTVVTFYVLLAYVLYRKKIFIKV